MNEIEKMEEFNATDPMMLNTHGITAASRALNAANIAAASSKNGPKYKKAPDAPKRFKSAFIIFSAEKHKEIKEDLIKQGRTEKTTDIAKLVSEAWREMPSEEKEDWETKARKDKARYEVEKATYKGPWKIPANKRTPKDPTAPKRPMSAFLAFSNKRRAGLKREHPDATNADLSKMLSITWREAPDELRKKYMDEEASLRATYKVDVANWRKKVAEEKKIERTEREAVAMQTAEARANDPPNQMMNNMNALAAGNNPVNRGTFNPVPGTQGGLGLPLHPQQDMNGGLSVFNNPYGMPGGTGQLAQFGNFGMQGGGPDASQYAGIMSGQNPFAAQQFMGNPAATQQQLINQLFAGQQFKNQMPQPNGLGMYPGLAGQAMQGGFNNSMGAYGAFGMPNTGGMDMAAQRAMMDAAQSGQMQQAMQSQPMSQMNQVGVPGSFQGGLSVANTGNDWMNQQQPTRLPETMKKEGEDGQQQQPQPLQYR